MFKKSLMLFLVLLSQQAAATSYSFGFASDAGMKLPGAKLVHDGLVAEGLTELILGGDQLYNTKDSYEDVWGDWTEFNWFAVAHGNHYLTLEQEQKYFGMPSDYYAKNAGKNIRFLILNSESETNINEQAAWYENQLAQAKEQFLFVVLHHPPYTLSKYHTWEEREEFHKIIRPITMKYQSKITSIFTGHDHFAALYRLNDLTWVHSGAALQHKAVGVAKTDVEPGIMLKTEWLYDQTYHFTRLDVNDATGVAKVSFIRAKDLSRSCIVTLAPVYSMDETCESVAMR